MPFLPRWGTNASKRNLFHKCFGAKLRRLAQERADMSEYTRGLEDAAKIAEQYGRKKRRTVEEGWAARDIAAAIRAAKENAK